MYFEDLWVMINIAVPVACSLKIGLMDSMRVYTNLYMVWGRDCKFHHNHKQFSVAFLKIVEFMGEVLIFAINHDFKCTDAVINTMLSFSYILFTIFCDVVHYVSILFCPDFNCQSRMKWWFLCMRKSDGSSVFLLFSYVIFVILYKLFLLYFTLYGIHVYIHIFVHTMEAWNKDYYYYYYHYYYIIYVFHVIDITVQPLA